MVMFSFFKVMAGCFCSGHSIHDKALKGHARRLTMRTGLLIFFKCSLELPWSQLDQSTAPKCTCLRHSTCSRDVACTFEVIRGIFPPVSVLDVLALCALQCVSFSTLPDINVVPKIYPSLIKSPHSAQSGINPCLTSGKYEC